jgi:diadenosine tetraphosphate (Ap4A) HIT family hydrolase
MVKETAFWRVDESFDIKLKGLYFIKPKRHIEGPEELDKDERKELGELIREFSLKSKKETKAKKIIVFSLGFKVPHLHFWVIPVTQDTLPHILKISKAVKQFADFYRRKI